MSGVLKLNLKVAHIRSVHDAARICEATSWTLIQQIAKEHISRASVDYREALKLVVPMIRMVQGPIPSEALREPFRMSGHI